MTRRGAIIISTYDNIANRYYAEKRRILEQSVMNIKSKIIVSGIFMMNGGLSLIYFFLKLFPIKSGKILFCSRQSDSEPLDFLLIKNEIGKRCENAEFVTICSRTEHNATKMIKFAAQVLKSMYHLATSSVCIVDSYWPTVSVLKHKKDLKVIQIWHSIGKMKKSGFQALDKKSGRNGSYARALKMHNNYDYLIGGSPVWNKYYCEAFNISEEKILNYGLPRIDYLLDTQQRNKDRFLKEFPQWKDKKIVLYAPTFRRNMKSEWSRIADAQKYDDIVIIVKNHPGQAIDKEEARGNIAFIDDWETIDLIAACDYMITDYSSIALEAAVLRKKTFYWVYDYDEYMENSGININLKKEMSGNVFENIDDLMYCVKNDKYNSELQEWYIKKYLPAELGKSTEKIATLTLDLIREQVNMYETGYNGRRQGEQMEGVFRDFKTLGGSEWRAADLSDNKVVDYGGSEELRDHSNIS